MSTTTEQATTDPGPGGAAPSTRSGDPGWLRDLGWRMALAVVAATLSAANSPVWLTTSFTTAAVIAVVERVVRHRRRGMVDAALVGTGMLVVVLGLLGLALNYLPGGLGRLSWTVGAVLLAIIVLTAAGLSDEVPASAFRPLFSRSSLPTAIWGVVSASILAVALIISVQSFGRTHVAPLDLSASAVKGGFSSVTVAAGSDQGPFQVDLVTSTARITLAKDITVSSGKSVAVLVPIPSGERVVVQLVQPSSTVVLRQLIFDTTPTAGTTSASTGSSR
ncbi:hypothetical protein ABIB25_004831 [Nakamurella sp. UYEF19]|uniref:hypothetical protein n=1 Tax=Nakamurella sp. UYEF19 TaxID=1756392 RepID=UPI003399B94B